MNLCKFGIHDWELFYDSNKLVDLLTEDLEKRGFELKEFKDCIPFHTNRKIDINQWGFYSDEDTIESCIPIGAKTKVCLNCKKIKKTYNLDDVFSRLDNIITRKTNDYNRREKAKSIVRGE